MKGCTNTLRRRVDRRDILIFGGIMDCRSGTAVEAYHDTGYDVVLIDREHTALNTETVCEQIRLARALDFPCMIRAADDSYHEINRLLDQAPDGIFVPRIRSREQAENVVRTVKYAPQGIRGLGGSTCPVGKYIGWKSVVDQIKSVNKNLVVGIQIETAEALADLDGILSVPGIDIAVVGNDDLSMGMKIPGQLASSKYKNAVKKIIKACQKHDVMPGIACGDPDLTKYWISQGMRAIWYGADSYFLWAGIAQQIELLNKKLHRKGK